MFRAAPSAAGDEGGEVPQRPPEHRPLYGRVHAES